MSYLTAKRAHLNLALPVGDVSVQIPPLLTEDVMTRHPICVSTQSSAYELVRTFHEQQFRHLLVVDGAGRLAGVISDRDVLRCFDPDGSPAREHLEEIRAEQLMSEDVITIEPNAPLSQAVGMMLTHGINCLPVVSEGKLCGILTSTDFYLVLERLLGAKAVAAE
jgi:CBS domain-containing protein